MSRDVLRRRSDPFLVERRAVFAPCFRVFVRILRRKRSGRALCSSDQGTQASMGAAMNRSRLYAAPCTQKQARAFVASVHRHHKPSVGGVFCLACVDETGVVRGVAMVGRPVARGACDGFTLEVNRVATDGCANACSFLLGAARRVAFQLGYRKIITYTLPEELSLIHI